MSEPADSVTRRMVTMGMLALSLGLGVPRADAENRLGGHFGVVFPLVSHSNGDTTTIDEDFQLGFPMGITVKKSDTFAFDLELVPGINNDPQRVSLTVHPGVLFGLGHGYTLGTRLAFDVSGDAWGFTPLLNKAFPHGDHALFVEAVVPIRFSEDAEGQGHTSVGFALHLGVGF